MILFCISVSTLETFHYFYVTRIFGCININVFLFAEVIVSVNATDRDLKENGEIEYSIVSDNKDVFGIDLNSGESQLSVFIVNSKYLLYAPFKVCYKNVLKKVHVVLFIILFFILVHNTSFLCTS